MQTEKLKEHEWLQQLVGEWGWEAELTVEPGKPPAKYAGSERVRSLGGLWMLCEGCGEMPGGGSANTLMTLGYDMSRQRFVGTWIGSMMTHLWVYDGEFDGESNQLVLNSEGPSCRAEGVLVKNKDVIRFDGQDRREWISYMPDDDGEWKPVMEAHYFRKS